MNEEIEKRNCFSCGRPIVLVPTHKKKDGTIGKMPVNAESFTDGETKYMHGKHISHFSDCPQANKFRKPRKEINKNE